MGGGNQLPGQGVLGLFKLEGGSGAEEAGQVVLGHFQLLLPLFVVFDQAGLLEKLAVDLLDLAADGGGSGGIEVQGGVHRFELLAAALACEAVAQGHEVLHPRRITAVHAAGFGELLLHALQLVEQIAAGLGHTHAIGLTSGPARCSSGAAAEIGGG